MAESRAGCSGADSSLQQDRGNWLGVVLREQVDRHLSSKVQLHPVATPGGSKWTPGVTCTLRLPSADSSLKEPAPPATLLLHTYCTTASGQPARPHCRPGSTLAERQRARLLIQRFSKCTYTAYCRCPLPAPARILSRPSANTTVRALSHFHSSLLLSPRTESPRLQSCLSTPRHAILALAPRSAPVLEFASRCCAVLHRHLVTCSRL